MPPKGADKKDDKPKSNPVASKNPASEIGLLLLALALGGALLARIVAFIGSGGISRSDIFDDLQDFYGGYKLLAGVFIVGLFAFFFSISRRISEIRAAEERELNPKKMEEETPQQVVNRKWQRVIDHLESANPGDWKLAIIEADIILDEMLTKMGYEGGSVGERLKSVERSDFTTIDDAWEAHKVRNLIAHQGADFVVTQREALRVIELYKRVFEEFFFI